MLLVRNVKWYNHFRTQSASWSGKHLPTIWLNYSTHSYLPRKMKAHDHKRFIHEYSQAALCVISKNRKQPKSINLTGKWVKKMWCVCRIDYYSATKRNELSTHAISGMNLIITTLSKTSQTKEHEYIGFHLYKILENETNLQWQKAHQQLSGKGWSGGLQGSRRELLGMMKITII